MTAPFTGRAPLRVMENPLGDDALDLPTPEEVRALWAAIRAKPVPGYGELRRLVIRGRE